MSDLFPIEETLSPRLKWMREQGIKTLYDGPDGKDPWCAWCLDNDEENHPRLPGACGFGDTEDEAIVELAKKLNLKLWNE